MNSVIAKLKLTMDGVVANLKLTLGIVSLMWAVFLVNAILPIDLRNFGIHPREISGLTGIIFAPFLHGNLTHILGNSLALLPLLLLSFSYNRTRSIGAISVIVLVGGLGTWLFGSPGSNHFGASGLVFGLIGYLLFVGFYFRDWKAIVTSLLVMAGFGGLLFSLFIVMPGVSWASHLFGFLSGIFAAKLAKKAV
jgi:membrane associated rhomboid family serine protease